MLNLDNMVQDYDKMEEKERFVLEHFENQLIDVYDNKLNSHRVMFLPEIFDLLNQQDKRIKELEYENGELKERIGLLEEDWEE